MCSSGKPFYAYMPFTQVHFPTLPHPKFAGKTGFGDFPDVLAEMDEQVGEILDAVDELRIRASIIVAIHERQWSGSEMALPGA